MRPLPTPRETIGRLLSLGIITSDDARRYLENYEFFERNRSWIEANYHGKWTASLNSRLFTDDHLEALRARITNELYDNRAYIEHVGVWD